MRKEKVVKDFSVYKDRFYAIMECFKIDGARLAKSLGVLRWRALIYNQPTQEQLELLAKFFDVSKGFLKGEMLDSYTSKELDVLIYIERKIIKEEIAKIKREIFKFLEEKYKEHCKLNLQD